MPFKMSSTSLSYFIWIKNNLGYKVSVLKKLDICSCGIWVFSWVCFPICPSYHWTGRNTNPAYGLLAQFGDHHEDAHNNLVDCITWSSSGEAHKWNLHMSTPPPPKAASHETDLPIHNWLWNVIGFGQFFQGPDSATNYIIFLSTEKSAALSQTECPYCFSFPLQSSIILPIHLNVPCTSPQLPSVPLQASLSLFFLSLPSEGRPPPQEKRKNTIFSNNIQTISPNINVSTVWIL